MARANNAAAARSRVLARNAANDGTIGATLGLLVVAGFIACNIDIKDALSQSAQPLSSLAGLVAMVVVQAAIVAGLGGMAVRRLNADD